MTQYGQIIAATSVRAALKTTIETWSPAYLSEVGAQHGRARDALPPFASYSTSTKRLSKWPESQLPACVLVVPGIVPNTLEKHEGKYSVEWPVGVGVICSARDQDETNELVELYTAAVRALLLQHKSLGGFATDTIWYDEVYNELDYEKSRSLAGGMVNLGVRVDAVLDSGAGLTAPPYDPVTPPGDLPVVVTVGTEVNGTVGTFENQEIEI